MTKKIIPKKSHQDIVVSIDNFNQIEGELLGHVCTFQIKRKYLPKLKKILKEMFEKENMF